MNVNPITSTTARSPATAVQRKPETGEVNLHGDHDGDADDGGASRPTTNAGGQKLGQIVNAKA
jgi:hypothetical protein